MCLCPCLMVLQWWSQGNLWELALSALWFLRIKLRLSGLAAVTLTAEPSLVFLIWVWIDLGTLGWGHRGPVVQGAMGTDRWLASWSRGHCLRRALRFHGDPMASSPGSWQAWVSAQVTLLFTQAGLRGICAPGGCLPW